MLQFITKFQYDFYQYFISLISLIPKKNIQEIGFEELSVESNQSDQLNNMKKRRFDD